MSAIDFDAASATRMNWLDLTGGPADGGLTVLDHFAGEALAGMLAENGGGALDNRDLAVIAYEVAEAMLRERNKRSKPTSVTQGISGKTYG